MAVLSLYASSLTSGSVTTSSAALGAPNGTFTTDTGNTNWGARFAMDDPPAGATASGTHTVTLRVRKSTGTNDPQVSSITLYQGAASVGSAGPFNVTSTTGMDVSMTFDVGLLTDLNAVEFEVSTVGAGGSPSARSSVQLDAVTWSGNFNVVVTGSAAPSGSGTLAAVGQKINLAKFTGSGTLAAVGQGVTVTGATASLTGHGGLGATVTDTGTLLTRRFVDGSGFTYVGSGQPQPQVTVDTRDELYTGRYWGQPGSAPLTTSDYWVWEGTLADLGLPAGATATSIKLAASQFRHDFWYGIQNWTWGPFELQNGAGSPLGTLWAGTTWSSAGSQGTYVIPPQSSITGSWSSTDTIRILLRTSGQVFNVGYSFCELDSAFDEIPIQVSYTPAAASLAGSGTLTAVGGVPTSTFVDDCSTLANWNPGASPRFEVYGGDRIRCWGGTGTYPLTTTSFVLDSIIFEVGGYTVTSPSAQFGVKTGSVYGFNRTNFTWQVQTGVTSASFTPVVGVRFLALRRTGGQITYYQSADGVTWSTITTSNNVPSGPVAVFANVSNTVTTDYIELAGVNTGHTTLPWSTTPAGTASLTGSGTLTATATPRVVAMAAQTGYGAILTAPSVAVSGTAAFGGDSLLYPSSQTVFTGDAALGGAGVSTASGTPTLLAAGALATSGAGVSTASGTPTLLATGATTGAGASAATGTPEARGAANTSGSGTLTQTTTPALSDSSSPSTGAGVLTAQGPTTASVDLAGDGSLAALGTAALVQIASLAGDGSPQATGTPQAAGTQSLAGTGSLAALGSGPALTQVVDLVGYGASLTAATSHTAGQATLGGGGLLHTQDQTAFTDTAALAGGGLTAAVGSPTLTATGAQAAAGVGVLSAEGLPSTAALASLSATGTAAASGTRATVDAVVVAGVGQVESLGAPGFDGVAHLSATATLTVTAIAPLLREQAYLSAAGVLTSTAVGLGLSATRALASAGALAGAGKATFATQAFLTSDGQVTSVTVPSTGAVVTLDGAGDLQGEGTSDFRDITVTGVLRTPLSADARIDTPRAVARTSALTAEARADTPEASIRQAWMARSHT